MNMICNWRPVFEVFESRLSLWKGSVLSLGRRVTLIKAVLESLPNYFFSLYKAPVRVIKDLEKLIRRFLWEGSNGGAKLHWVAWDHIASPVRAGGIGLCSLGIINKALPAKWGWRFKNESNSYWVKVINTLHRHKLCWDFLSIKSFLNGVWSNIVKVCSNQVGDNLSLSSFMRGDLGNGRELLFWLDPWLLPNPLKDEMPSLFRLEAQKCCTVKDRLVLPVSNPNGKWEWRTVPNSNVEIAEWSRLCSLLQSIDLSDRADRWSWLGVGSNGFSIGAVKRLFELNSDYSSRFVWDWCKWLPKKCNLFAWRAEQDRIPTREALKRRDIYIEDDICPQCKLEVESVDHLFTSCGVSSVIWQKIQAWCKTSNLYVFSFQDILEVHKWVGLDGQRKEAFHGIAILTCWSIWKARNNLVFSGKPFRITEVFSEIRSLGYVLYKNRSKDRGISWEDWCKYVICIGVVVWVVGRSFEQAFCVLMKFSVQKKSGKVRLCILCICCSWVCDGQWRTRNYLLGVRMRCLTIFSRGAVRFFCLKYTLKFFFFQGVWPPTLAKG
ncbi:putative reverse transcriptase zinc-binding domain-containing protein [Helianthus anomalus]